MQKHTSHNVPSMFGLSIKFYLRHVRYEDEECTPFLGIFCWIGFQCRGIVAIGKPYDDSEFLAAGVWIPVLLSGLQRNILRHLFLNFFSFIPFTTNLSRKPP